MRLEVRSLLRGQWFGRLALNVPGGLLRRRNVQGCAIDELGTKRGNVFAELRTLRGGEESEMLDWEEIRLSMFSSCRRCWK